MTRLSAPYLLLASVACILPACVADPGPGGVPPAHMTFAHLQPLSVHVRSVDIVNAAGGTEGDFVYDPMNATQDYIKSRFAPQGMQETLAVTIEEASVRKAEKPSGNNVARFFNVGGHEIYNVTLRLRFEHKDEGGRVLYGKVLTGRRKMEIDEHASVAKREKHEMEGLGILFRDMDREITHLVMEDMRLGM